MKVIQNRTPPRLTALFIKRTLPRYVLRVLSKLTGIITGYQPCGTAWLQALTPAAIQRREPRHVAWKIYRIVRENNVRFVNELQSVNHIIITIMPWRSVHRGASMGCPTRHCYTDTTGKICTLVKSGNASSFGNICTNRHLKNNK